MLRPLRLHSVFPVKEFDDRVLEETDVASRREIVGFEIQDRVCDELAGAMEGGLAAAEGGVEGCLAPGGRLSEVVDLFFGDGGDFAPAAGVYGVELGGDYRGLGSRCCGWVGFVGEEGADKAVLESGGMGVGG